MKIVNVAICTLGILLCHACASTSEQVKYYRLIPDTSIENNQHETDVIRVIISPVRITKILRQEGIVNQIGENEVNIAQYHRWANPLDEAIARSLVKTINSKTHLYHFEKLTTQINQHASYTLSLSIEKFDIRDDASVNISGRYSLLNRNTIPVAEHSFNFKQSLIKNGYPHAVEKLKQALGQLAEKILTDLEMIRKDTQ